MDELLEQANYAINKLIRRDARKEAKLIIMLTTDQHRKSFVDFFNEDQGNIACLILDKAKQELVEQNILKQKETDAFGKPF